MNGMDLDAVEPRLLRDLGRVGELPHVGLHLDVGQLAADDAGEPAMRDRRRADRRSADEAGHADPAEAGRKLKEHARVIGVDALGQDLAGLEEIARIEGRARHRGHRAVLDLVLDKGDAGHDQAGAARAPARRNTRRPAR